MYKIYFNRYGLLLHLLLRYNYNTFNLNTINMNQLLTNMERSVGCSNVFVR